MGLLEQILAAQRNAGANPQRAQMTPQELLANPSITQATIDQMRGPDAMQPMPNAQPIGPPSLSPEDAMQLLGGQGGGAQPTAQQIDPAMIQSLLEHMQRNRERPPVAQPAKPQPLWGKR